MRRTRTVARLAMRVALIGCVILLSAGAAQAVVLVSEDFDSYTLGTHVSVAPPPGPGDFPTLNGGLGWGTPYRSHIGAGLEIRISAGPTGNLFDGTGVNHPTSFWRDRMMDPDIHGNSDGTVTWQAMDVSTAGAGDGAFRVNNSNGGMDYKVLLDGGNAYELRGGHIDLVSAPSGIAASTNINSPDFVLTKVENIAGGQSTVSTWINPNLAGGEGGLGAADMTLSYAPFAGNRNIGEIVLSPGLNIRLDNIIFASTFVDLFPPEPGKDFVWDGEANGNWDNAANWDANLGHPDGVDHTAKFQGGVNTTVNLNGDRQVETITFTDANAFTLQNNTLTISDGGSITKETTGTVNQTLDCNVALAGDATFTNNNNWVHNQHQLIVNGNLTGNGTLHITGTGTGGVRLEGDNSGFTGEIQLDSGMLLVGSNNALGDTAGKTFLNGGQVWFDSNANTAEDFIVTADTTQASLLNNTQSGTFTVNPGATFFVRNGGGNMFRLTGTVTGAGNWHMAFGNTRFEGTQPNTLTGKTTFDTGSTNQTFRTVWLSKPDGVDAIAGDLDVIRNARILWTADEQLADIIDVLVDAAGSTSGLEAMLDLDSHTETIDGLTLLNGGWVETGEGGVLNVNELIVDGEPFDPGRYDAQSPFVAGLGHIQVGAADVIPEPCTLTLLGLGAMALAARRRKR